MMRRSCRTIEPYRLAVVALLSLGAAACASGSTSRPVAGHVVIEPPAIAVATTRAATTEASASAMALVSAVLEDQAQPNAAALELDLEANSPHAAEAPEDLTDDEIRVLIESDPEWLGALSLGRPNAGALMNAIQMPEGDGWERIDPWRSWATQETVDYLIHAIKAVDAQFERTHPLYVGHLSYERGGPMRPHLSHQSGRDVDLSYYYLPNANPGWYQKASQRTLDKPRTWALLRTMLTETDIEYVFIDRSVQKLLKEYALSIGEDPAWLNEVFQFRSRNPEPLIRHAYGHKTHIHVRFYNPQAQKLGIRTYDLLSEAKLIKPQHYFTRYRVQPGDSIAALAHKFGTSPRSIRKTNGVTSLQLKPGRLYYMPTRGRVSRVDKVEIPPRRLPPPPTSSRMHGVAVAQ